MSKLGEEGFELNNIEMILHIDKGIDYFYEYLEQCVVIQEKITEDDPTEQNRLLYEFHNNNLKLLGLFMDIRCYDQEII